jgi:hypothetical protein
MMKESNAKEGKQFRRLFDKWTPEQENFAEKFVSYILIQTKNKSEKANVIDILPQCTPMTDADTAGPVKSFEHHAAQNPYLSTLMDFDWPHSDQHVEFVPAATLLCGKTEEVEKHQDALTETNERLEVARGDTKKNLEAKIKRTTKAISFLQHNKQQMSGQIAVAVHGLDSYGYKRLENRDNCKRYLQEISDDTRDPCQGVKMADDPGAVEVDSIGDACNDESGDESDV